MEVSDVDYIMARDQVRHSYSGTCSLSLGDQKAARGEH